MVFVFDASSAMGDLLLETAWTYAAATLAQFNLQYPNYTTSVGHFLYVKKLESIRITQVGLES